MSDQTQFYYPVYRRPPALVEEKITEETLIFTTTPARCHLVTGSFVSLFYIPLALLLSCLGLVFVCRFPASPQRTLVSKRKSCGFWDNFNDLSDKVEDTPHDPTTPSRWRSLRKRQYWFNPVIFRTFLLSEMFQLLLTVASSIQWVRTNHLSKLRPTSSYCCYTLKKLWIHPLVSGWIIEN